MNAQQFLKSKGESYPERVRFHTAGSTVSIPLEDLLTEFATQSVVVVESDIANVQRQVNNVAPQDKENKFQTQ